MENLSLYERYPTKSSNYISRTTPSSRISFAVGTKFNSRFERRLSDMIKRSKYTIKPIKREKDALTRYRAPAATIPVGPYPSVSHGDYGYPSDELLRAMNPNPKWIYRSRSDLGAGRILDHDYQYFNTGRLNTNNGERNESRDESKTSISNQKTNTARSPIVKPCNNGNDASDSQNLSKEIPDESYHFYKTPIGTFKDRYSENSFMKRGVEGENVISSKSDNRKHPFVPGQIRFTNTLNRVADPRAEFTVRLPRKLPGLIRHNTFDVNGDKNETSEYSEMQTDDQKRMTIQGKASSNLSIDKDMTRTHKK